MAFYYIVFGVILPTGITLTEINVAIDSAVYHVHAPYIIVAKPEDLAVKLIFRHDGKVAPDMYNDKISNSDAGQIQT